ncbi:hypothetical protein [Burkholderia sp. WSM2230]|uniref:hypothetical protein n=1 Tax=Burkholderia sp. WSM2230 TaxID=944435 RepID=UPI0004244699|nr:hypothetical protein [Burkholderia sp. WSM2230]
MGIVSKRAKKSEAETHKTAVTFFAPAAAEPKAKAESKAKAEDEAPKAAPKPATEEPKKPARTFFDSGRDSVDPIHSLSTHRPVKVMTEAERAARKVEEMQRVRRGTDWLMSVLTRR